MFITKKLLFIPLSIIIITTAVVLPIVIINNQNQDPITTPYAPNDEEDPIPYTETIIIAGVNFTFDIFLWRDFMPSFPSEPDGSDLMVVLYLKATNLISFPTENFTAKQMWVFHQNETWKADLEIQEIGYPTENALCLRADGGPKWNPFVYVNVTLELTYQLCTKYYISAFNQQIWRTD